MFTLTDFTDNVKPVGKSDGKKCRGPEFGETEQMAVVDVAGGWPRREMALAEDVPGGKWLKIGFADCLIRNCRGRQG